METGFIIVIALIVVAICVGIGMKIEERLQYKRDSKEVKGALNVVYDPQTNEPFLYLESYVPVAEMATQKRVILDVRILQ